MNGITSYCSACMRPRGEHHKEGDWYVCDQIPHGIAGVMFVRVHVMTMEAACDWLPS